MKDIALTKSLMLKKELKFDFVLYELARSKMMENDMKGYIAYPYSSIFDLMGLFKKKPYFLFYNYYSKIKKERLGAMALSKFLRNVVFLNECNYRDFRPEKKTDDLGVIRYGVIPYNSIYLNIIDYVGRPVLIDRFIKIESKEIHLGHPNPDKELIDNGKVYLYEYHISEAIIPFLENLVLHKPNIKIKRYIRFFKKIVEITNKSNSKDLDEYIHVWIKEIHQDLNNGYKL